MSLPTDGIDALEAEGKCRFCGVSEQETTCAMCGVDICHSCTDGHGYCPPCEEEDEIDQQGDEDDRE